MGKIKQSVELLLEGLSEEFGLDITDKNFHDTPSRVERAYQEIFGGLLVTDEEINKILSSAFPADGYDSLVLEPHIKTFSMCPHHLLPVEYDVTIAYLPNLEHGKYLGVSKLVRIAEIYARMPLLQEAYTYKVANTINDAISPDGIAVIVNGIHYCMRMRGVKNSTSVTTSAMLGSFRESNDLKLELFELIKIRR
jgi:GTP cyclohydrolase IA